MSKYKILVVKDEVTGDMEVWAESKTFFGLFTKREGILFDGTLNGGTPNTCVTQGEVYRTIQAFKTRQKLLSSGKPDYSITEVK